MKNIETFNRVLICKWKWRIMMEKEALREGILKHKYGNVALKLLTNENLVQRSMESIWWRDLKAIGENLELIAIYHVRLGEVIIYLFGRTND